MIFTNDKKIRLVQFKTVKMDPILFARLECAFKKCVNDMRDSGYTKIKNVYSVLDRPVKYTGNKSDQIKLDLIDELGFGMAWVFLTGWTYDDEKIGEDIK